LLKDERKRDGFDYEMKGAGGGEVAFTSQSTDRMGLHEL